MIKVSIIVPVYNTEKYLKGCLDSLVSQTYKNIEIVCINDGSQDNSLQILEEYRKRDNRIIIINQKNSGANISRTNGIKNSTGNYLMFVDSDDWILLNTVSELVDKIEQTNADIIKFDFINRKTMRTVEKKLYNFETKKQLYEKLLTTYELNNLTTEIINKKICNLEEKVFKNKSSAGEDLAVNLEIYDKANRILIMNECYYYYRTNSNSTTNTDNKESLYKNIEENKENYIYEYAQKWNLLTKKLENEILLRRFKFQCSYIIRIIDSKEFGLEDYGRLDNIIVNNEAIKEIKNRELINQSQDKKINKRIMILIINKKYKRVKTLIRHKKTIEKIHKK